MSRQRELEGKVVDLEMHLKMSRGCTSELREENATLRARIAELTQGWEADRVELERVTTHLEAYRAEETCMCGSPMKSHTMGDGHVPVSQLDYMLGQHSDELARCRADALEEAARVCEIDATILLGKISGVARFAGSVLNDKVAAIRALHATPPLPVLRRRDGGCVRVDL